MRISDWSSDVCSSDLATSGLFADPARIDILDEQRRGAEFGVAGAAVEHANDFETGVEPDEVGERDRTHRMVEAQTATRVDILHRCDALAEREDGFVDHRSEEHTSELQSLMRITY